MLVEWGGRGVIISDRMSYRNHYMCSGEATSRILSDKLFYRNATTHAFNFIVSSMKFNVFGRLVGVGEIN